MIPLFLVLVAILAVFLLIGIKKNAPNKEPRQSESLLCKTVPKDRDAKSAHYRAVAGELNAEFQARGISATARVLERSRRGKQHAEVITLTPGIPRWAKLPPEASCPYLASIDGIEYAFFVQTPYIAVYGPANSNMEIGIFLLTAYPPFKWLGERAIRPVAVKDALLQWSQKRDVAQAISIY
jgi:hypothetical protein